MAVVVTGANGFIGSHVVRRLVEQGREVRAFVQRGQPIENIADLDVEIVEGDLLDEQYPPRLLENVEVLYHLAAIYALWLPVPDKMYRVNVNATVRLLMEALKRDSLQKVVYTSSIAAVGTEPGEGIANEQTQFNGWSESNDYVLSKYISELEVQRLAMQYQLPVTIVNPGFPFGTHDLRPTPTGQLMVDYLNRKTPGLLQGGFSAVDVEDVAQGHLLAEAHGKIGERYLLVGHNLTYQDFARTLMKVAGVRRPLWVLPPEWLVRYARVATWVADYITHKPPQITPKTIRYSTNYLYFDNTKARTELGLTITPLEETIRKAIEWFRENKYIKA